MNRAQRRATARRIARDMKDNFGCNCKPQIAPITDVFDDALVDELNSIGSRLYDTLHQPGCPTGDAGAEAISHGRILIGFGTTPAPRRCER